MFRIFATLLLGFMIIVLTGNLMGCATVHERPRAIAQAAAEFGLISKEARRAHIATAQVWTEGDIRSKDLLNGPQDIPGARRFDQREVDCTFVPKDPKDTSSGRSPKFRCRLPSGEVIKIKYGSGEVHAEVAATRLLWALGFSVDAMYPVDVNCAGCPVDPWFDEGNPQPMVRFSPAATEVKFAGSKLESAPESGWKFNEFHLIDPARGGAPKKHLEAFELILAMLQHWDNKAANNRLVCPVARIGIAPDGSPVCSHAQLVVHDLGGSFGRSSLDPGDWKKMNLEEWIKPEASVWKDPRRVPVWKRPKDCVANLASYKRATLVDPAITEEGRQFAISLLDQLSDRQILDLFTAARPELRPKWPKNPGEWMHWFKRKVREIREHAPCSE